MKRVVDTILILGYVGIAFVYIHTTITLYLYNELIDNAFQFNKQQALVTKIRESTGHIEVEYEYMIDSTMYREYKQIGKKIFAQTNLSEKSVAEIYYNRSYPSYSYIKSIYDEDRKSIRYVFFAPFLIILLIATFTNRDRWIERYKRGFGWPVEKT